MCFTLMWWRDLLIFLVIIIALYSLIKLVVPWLLSKLPGDTAVLGRALDIVLWAFIVIVVIYFLFALIACLLSLGGGGFPLFPRR